MGTLTRKGGFGMLHLVIWCWKWIPTFKSAEDKVSRWKLHKLSLSLGQRGCENQTTWRFISTDFPVLTFPFFPILLLLSHSLQNPLFYIFLSTTGGKAC